MPYSLLNVACSDPQLKQRSAIATSDHWCQTRRKYHLKNTETIFHYENQQLYFPVPDVRIRIRPKRSGSDQIRIRIRNTAYRHYYDTCKAIDNQRIKQSTPAIFSFKPWTMDVVITVEKVRAPNAAVERGVDYNELWLYAALIIHYIDSVLRSWSRWRGTFLLEPEPKFFGPAPEPGM
jgi:hypothetical protein